MESGDSDLRRRSVPCEQSLAKIKSWDSSSDSQRSKCCHQPHSSDDSKRVRSSKKHATNGLPMSKVILLSVVVASICSIIVTASQQQASTTFSQAVQKSTSDAEISAHNLSADTKQTRQQQQQRNITTNQSKQPQAVADEHDSIASSTPETLSTTPLAPPNYSTQSSTVATLSQSTTTPANLVSPANVGQSRTSYVKLLNENGGDLSASSSVNIQSVQPKKSSQLAGGGNRWSQHFGARLRPLTPNGLIDHEAASSSKATAALVSDGRGFNRPPPLGQQQQPLLANRQAITGNFVDGNEDNRNQEEDYDDDSEALLYKMMQQQNFLMNPIFQEQPTPGNQQQLSSGRPEGQAQQRGQAAATGNGIAQQNDDLASSKKVIKLLKSYSHIHQVDDSDDQIRGTYTRLSSYRPNDGQMSSRDQYSSSSGSSSRSGNHNNAHNGNRRPINGQANNSNRQQHVFVSSRPVTASQTREQGVRVAAARQPHADGNYRQVASAQRGNSYLPANGNQHHSGNDHDGNSAPLDGNESQSGNENGEGANGSGPPSQEEEEFECPNNGIFADVASGCQAYHVCQSGAQVQERFNCPLGTLFNDIILTCDFAHNVQCGKKPGEQQAPQPAGLQNNDAAYNRQPSQQYQQQAAPRPQQVSLPTGGGYPRQPPQQQHHARPASQGPRQLIIGGGGSPYNQHNRQQQVASSQAAALGSYPAVKPLSNALSDADSDEDDDNEPLVPATLPPRAASTPQATGVIAPRLPYKAPPGPPATALVGPSQQQQQQPQQANVYSMPTSIQQQIPHQANRQSAHFSQYPPMQAQQRQPQQPQFYQRPAQMPNRYVTEASAPVRSYGEPNSPRPTEPSVAAPTTPQQQHSNQQQSASSPAVGSGSDGESFNLVINHVTPARGAEQRKPQQQQLPAQVQQAVRYAEPQEQRPAQKVTPVYKSQVSAERQQSRRLVAASYPIGQQRQQPQPQQPPAQVHHLKPQNVAVPNQQQDFQLQQHPGTQRQKLPFNSDQKYESQRSNNQNSHYHQQQQQSQHKARAPIDGTHHHQRATTPAYASEVAAATQRSVTHSSSSVGPQHSQQSNVNGLVDLTNGQQSSVGSENLNNGLLLIVRHSSGGPTLQVQNGGSSSSSAPKPVAYAVDPKIINPNSPVDSQLFPNVQQFVAEHHHHHHQGRAAGSVTQASTNRVTHVDPAAATQTGRYQVVAGSLPPMTPPEPPRDDERQQHGDQQVGSGGGGEQYGAASDQQSAADAIVPASSSSVAKNARTSPEESVAAAPAQQKQLTLTQQKPAASFKRIQQQQQTVGRTKRAKSPKSPVQLPKKLEKRTTSTTTTTTTTTSATPISAGATTTTTASTTNSAPNRPADSHKRKQQTLSRGN